MIIFHCFSSGNNNAWPDIREVVSRTIRVPGNTAFDLWNIHPQRIRSPTYAARRVAYEAS